MKGNKRICPANSPAPFDAVTNEICPIAPHPHIFMLIPIFLANPETITNRSYISPPNFPLLYFVLFFIFYFFSYPYLVFPSFHFIFFFYLSPFFVFLWVLNPTQPEDKSISFPTPPVQCRFKPFDPNTSRPVFYGITKKKKKKKIRH